MVDGEEMLPGCRGSGIYYSSRCSTNQRLDRPGPRSQAIKVVASMVKYQRGYRKSTVLDDGGKTTYAC